MEKMMCTTQGAILPITGPLNEMYEALNILQDVLYNVTGHARVIKEIIISKDAMLKIGLAPNETMQMMTSCGPITLRGE